MPRINGIISALRGRKGGLRPLPPPQPLTPTSSLPPLLQPFQIKTRKFYDTGGSDKVRLTDWVIYTLTFNIFSRPSRNQNGFRIYRSLYLIYKHFLRTKFYHRIYRINSVQCYKIFKNNFDDIHREGYR